MNLLSLSLLAAASDIPVMVGFSGGLDSTVLLHLLAHAPERRPGSVRALHVHHGLQALADAWLPHCSQLCAHWNIPLQMVRVEVPLATGNGPEAAAREARHAAFKAHLQEGEWLALAHHLDDQAETFLLRALRGSGVDGLAAMRERRAFGGGQLWRPLLHVPRADLLAYAQAHDLTWIEDPSNGSDAFDRNFLRLQVMPLIAQRWPHAAAALARSAALSSEAATQLALQDATALHQALENDALSITALEQLPDALQARVLRRWVQQLGLPPLPANGVQAIQHQLLPATGDRLARFRWRDVAIVRWRHALHAVRPQPAWPANWQQAWDGRAPVVLPDGATFTLQGVEAFERPLILRQRRGGERIQLAGRDHRHSLKHCLQASVIPPWLRPRLPLLCDGEEVLAAADRIVSGRLQAWLQAHGARLHWQPVQSAN